MSEVKKSNALTFTGDISVDFTFIARDLTTAEEQIQKLIDGIKHPDFTNLPVKNQVMIELIHEAYQKEGLEGGLRELFRFNIRTAVNELMRDELATHSEECSIKVAPCRMRLGKARKVSS